MTFKKNKNKRVIYIFFNAEDSVNWKSWMLYKGFLGICCLYGQMFTIKCIIRLRILLRASYLSYIDEYVKWWYDDNV